MLLEASKKRFRKPNRTTAEPLSSPPSPSFVNEPFDAEIQIPHRRNIYPSLLPSALDSAFPLADDPSRIPTAYERYSRGLCCNPMLSPIYRLSSLPGYSGPLSKHPTTSLRHLSTSLLASPRRRSSPLHVVAPRLSMASLLVVIPRRHPPRRSFIHRHPRSPQILRAHSNLTMRYPSAIHCGSAGINLTRWVWRTNPDSHREW